MTIQILPNQIKIGQYVLQESSTGISFSGNVKSAGFVTLQLGGTVSGFTSGGYVSPFLPNSGQNTIDKFPFASNANATDFGDLSVARLSSSGQSSETYGYSSGGITYQPTSTFLNTIDRFAFSSNTTAADVGDLTIVREGSTGHSSSNNGYASGGRNPSPPNVASNTIDKFPFATSNSNATDVGDLTILKTWGAGSSSFVSGYNSGGYNKSNSNTINVIDKFPFSTDSNSSDVGDLTTTTELVSGHSSSTNGYASGGRNPSLPSFTSNVIDKFPFASNANATDVGDVTVSRYGAAGQSSTSSGYTSGGITFSPGAVLNVIDKFPFSSDSNSTDVGDLSQSRAYSAGQED